MAVKVAQLIEQLTGNQQDAGLNPTFDLFANFSPYVCLDQRPEYLHVAVKFDNDNNTDTIRRIHGYSNQFAALGLRKLGTKKGPLEQTREICS